MKKKYKILGILSRLILIIAAGAMILSYLAVYINPSKFSLPLLFGLFYIPLLILNFLLLIIALICRSRSFWIPLIALIPSIFYANLFVQIWAPTKEESNNKLTIESYNIGMFYSSAEHFSQKECKEKLDEHFKNFSPDIICLQEFYVENLKQADTLFKDYPHRFYHLTPLTKKSYFGNIILSKFPIENSGEIVFKKSSNHCIYADIKYKDKTFRVYNNHLESYNISFTNIAKKFSNSKNLTTEQISTEILATKDILLGRTIRRSDQVNTIAEHIRNSPYPSLICGDFNDTPMSYTYNIFSKGHKDSFREGGKGFGATFSNFYPLLRIDYILYPPEIFDCTNFTTEKISLSDHFPIFATLTIEE